MKNKSLVILIFICSLGLYWMNLKKETDPKSLTTLFQSLKAKDIKQVVVENLTENKKEQVAIKGKNLSFNDVQTKVPHIYLYYWINLFQYIKVVREEQEDLEQLHPLIQINLQDLELRLFSINQTSGHFYIQLKRESKMRTYIVKAQDLYEGYFRSPLDLDKKNYEMLMNRLSQLHASILHQAQFNLGKLMNTQNIETIEKKLSKHTELVFDLKQVSTLPKAPKDIGVDKNKLGAHFNKILQITPIAIEQNLKVYDFKKVLEMSWKNAQQTQNIEIYQNSTHQNYIKFETKWYQITDQDFYELIKTPRYVWNRKFHQLKELKDNEIWKMQLKKDKKVKKITYRKIAGKVQAFDELTGKKLDPVYQQVYCLFYGCGEFKDYILVNKKETPKENIEKILEIEFEGKKFQILKKPYQVILKSMETNTQQIFVHQQNTLNKLL